MDNALTGLLAYTHQGSFSSLSSPPMFSPSQPGPIFASSNVIVAAVVIIVVVVAAKIFMSASVHREPHCAHLSYAHLYPDVMLPPWNSLFSNANFIAKDPFPPFAAPPPIIPHAERTEKVIITLYFGPAPPEAYFLPVSKNRSLGVTMVSGSQNRSATNKDDLA